MYVGKLMETQLSPLHSTLHRLRLLEGRTPVQFKLRQAIGIFFNLGQKDFAQLKQQVQPLLVTFRGDREPTGNLIFE